MINRTIIAFLSVAVSICLCSCNDKTEPQERKASMEVSLHSFYSAQGLENPTWKITRQLTAISNSSGNMVGANPSSRDVPTSKFNFTFKSLDDGEKFVLLYNATDVRHSYGNLSYEIPVNQDGIGVNSVAFIGRTTYKGNSGFDAAVLNTTTSLVKVTVPKTSGVKIVSVSIESNGNEGLAGSVSVNGSDWTFKASQKKVIARLAAPADCSSSDVSIPVWVAPVTLSKGYTISFETTGSGLSDIVETGIVSFEQGGIVSPGKPARKGERQLLICGATKVYCLDCGKLTWSGSYKDGISWRWDCSSVGNVVPVKMAGSHIDDCKMVDDSQVMLVTCSNNTGWMMAMKPDFDSQSSADLLFYATGCANAHSSEMLPGEKVVVACADGTDKLYLYDMKTNNKLIASYPCKDAHGSVWMEKTKRLYTIGGTTLSIWKLNSEWDKAPELELESTIETTSVEVSGLHDLNIVDERTLIMGGYRAALFDVVTKTFTSLGHFNYSASYPVKGIKSLNYDPVTGECYYTYAYTNGPDLGSYAWSTHKIRHTKDVQQQKDEDYYTTDFDTYKVRILNW